MGALNRRQLLLGAVGAATWLGGCEPGETEIVVGRPEEFRPGPTFIREARVFIIRDGRRFRALDAVCTHQNCTVAAVWMGVGPPGAFFLSCPCHAGQYAADGTPTAGPPPAPLAHFPLHLSPTGELIVDRGRPIAGEEVWLEV